ncbi:MAG: RNA polymerase-associated protein rapA [Sedimenticola sp.]
MFKRTPISLAVAALLVLPAAAMAEIEVSGYVKNETALYIQDGQRTGQATTTLDTAGGDAGDVMKFENSVRLFVNGDVGEESSFHADINLIHDAKGVNSDYKGHRNFTQNDWLREIYLDTTAADWDFRIGKQQEVWGTADGIKLLDIINPTDFREMNQNTMEDARIPVFMVKGERDVGDNGNFQFIISQAEENKIPGLNSDGDAGHPFIMKGVDTITGKVNGFLNIAPALAGVASNFSEVARTAPGGAMGFDVTGDGVPDAMPTALSGFAGLTVDGFAGTNQFTNAMQSIICSNPAGCTGLTTATAGGALLENFTENGASFGLPYSNSDVTNLSDSAGYVSSTPTASFEYMSMATFATFNTFASNVATSAPFVQTQYKRDYPDGANAGFRFRNSTNGGLNYSLNYFAHYDANPSVNISWHDAVTGEKLDTVIATTGNFGGAYMADPTGAGTGIVGSTITRNQVPSSFTLDGNGYATDAASVLLQNAAGQYYGAVAPNPTLTSTTNGAVLRFTETSDRVHSLGTSFDYAFDTATAPIVLRGEFLYQKDTKQPVIDRRLLAIGDLEGALTMQDANMFKYVLGVDVTVMTNLMVSGQFIQFRNLDYVDTSRTCTTQVGNSINCSKYTADFATLHLSNDMNKGEENKEFFSLFFSKPFGESQLGRWNNITIYEEGGGWWNRFDVEYSFSDQLVGTAELNTYWGDENTTFGQFQESSSIQLGVKYLFD